MRDKRRVKAHVKYTDRLVYVVGDKAREISWRNEGRYGDSFVDLIWKLRVKHCHEMQHCVRNVIKRIQQYIVLFSNNLLLITNISLYKTRIVHFLATVDISLPIMISVLKTRALYMPFLPRDEVHPAPKLMPINISLLIPFM
uniref:Uncharacterized protein n=1 Tax=Heterorhabditis bacteriophora TaxID=37862 RepID=A0A1I7WK85_HETBA